ncbi:MAG: hypothetical protein C6Y22_21630 [Hapalosiphonaceae cyanobacterium JJU2]|nr:MAG: hypothetical protein C6Y22_21630 [Hapalosiphonaceae cyanobacterium JJU2]
MNKTEIIESLTFTVSLSFEMHKVAQQYCQRQFSREKVQQVYHNTLAVQAVNFYLECIGWQTDWTESDSHDPVMQAFTDVADLEVKNYGKLECRPVFSDTEACHVPPDVWEDRIGYLVVHLNESLTKATILGFTPTVEEKQGIIPLCELRSLAEFPEYLSHFKPVNLCQWFQGIFESGWLLVEEVLSKEQIELAFGNARGQQPAFISQQFDIMRARKIDLGMKLASHSVALIVSPRPADKEEVDILVQVHPLPEKTYLPEGIKMIVQDEKGTDVLDTKSRKQDNYIQLKFTAESGEYFSIKVALENASVTESFLIPKI